MRFDALLFCVRLACVLQAYARLFCQSLFSLLAWSWRHGLAHDVPCHSWHVWRCAETDPSMHPTNVMGQRLELPMLFCCVTCWLLAQPSSLLAQVLARIV
jgi:hypothetical protein